MAASSPFTTRTAAARRRSLVTGETELLTFGPDPVDGAAAFPLLLSPDGQRMAYMWAERAPRGNANEPTRIAFDCA